MRVGVISRGELPVLVEPYELVYHHDLNQPLELWAITRTKRDGFSRSVPYLDPVAYMVKMLEGGPVLLCLSERDALTVVEQIRGICRFNDLVPMPVLYRVEKMP